MLQEIFGDIFLKAPKYEVVLEVSLFLMVIWLFLYKKKSSGKSNVLSQEQKEEIIRKYKPEPLVPDVPEDHPALKPHIVNGAVGKRINVDGFDCLNLGTLNYMGVLEDENVKESAINAIKKYGVGSCGPRGFYGTVDVHLDLEEKLAKFMDMEEAVVYSYAFSTIASAIPAYSKRPDVIFVDECVNFAIQKGLDASRSRIVYFKHNDMKDLEDKLKEQEKLDKKNPKKAAKTRRFLVAEGIYFNTGEMCPLRELVELRKKYKLRLFLDESVSFGTIGKHGRGLTEFLNVDKSEVDLISGSLESSVGSIGGFCVGSHFIIEHQRLSGLGYCFSASAPPLTAQAAITALNSFENHPEMFKQLNEINEKLHNKFQELSEFTMKGHPISPVKHLYLKSDEEFEAQTKKLRAISDMCIKNGLAVVVSEYLEVEKFPPQPSIRIAVCRLLTDDDISFAFKVLEEASTKLS